MHKQLIWLYILRRSGVLDLFLINYTEVPLVPGLPFGHFEDQIWLFKMSKKIAYFKAYFRKI